MPTLNVPSLRTQVQRGTLAPVYLLFGEDVREVEALVDAIEGTVAEADRPFAVERLYAGEEHATPVNIVAAASVLPMLGDRRIVIVMRAERLLKPARRGASAGDGESDERDQSDEDAGGSVDTTALEAYLDHPSPSSSLVFVAAAIDRTRRLTKRLLEKAQCVEFGGLSAPQDRGRGGKAGVDDPVEMIRHAAAADGRTMDARTAQLLISRAGGDISKLRADLERLVLFTEGRPAITRGDVEELVREDQTQDDWAVVNAIGDGDAPRALREVAVRLDRGDSPHALVGQLRWWVANRLPGAAPDRVKPAMASLLRTDLALKSSGGDERVLIERLVVELAGKPVPRQGWSSGRR